MKIDKKQITSISLILAAIVFLSSCGGQYPEPGKSSEPQSTATNTHSLTEVNERIIAVFTPESRNAFLDNTPTIIDDYIYIGTSCKIPYKEDRAAVIAQIPDSFFYKMDLDLNVVWKYPLGKAQVAGGASLDARGNIYFLTSEHSVNPDTTSKDYLALMNLVSLTNDGQFRWKKQVSADNQEWMHSPATPAIGVDDTIYIGNSKFFAFDTDGNIKWQYPADERVVKNYRGSPIIDHEANIYFVSPEISDQEWATETIRAYKFSPSGDLLWSTVLENNPLYLDGSIGRREQGIVSTPAFSTGETSLYAAVGNTINRVSTDNGILLWSFQPVEMTGYFTASPAVDAEDNIYIGTKSNEKSLLYGIKADGSGLLWENLIGADMYPSPFLGDDGKVYVGSETTRVGHIHAVDMKTGKTIWATGTAPPMADIGMGSPVLYKGYIYVGVCSINDEQALPEIESFFKVKADALNYLPDSPWPRFHGSNASHGRTVINP